VEEEDMSIASMHLRYQSTVNFPHKLRLSNSSCSHEYVTSVHSKSRMAWIKICHILVVLV